MREPSAQGRVSSDRSSGRLGDQVPGIPTLATASDGQDHQYISTTSIPLRPINFVCFSSIIVVGRNYMRGAIIRDDDATAETS